MQKGLNRLLSLVLPVRCVGCGEMADAFLCERCREGVVPIAHHCTRCAEPLPTGFYHLCGGCIEKNLSIDFALTCYPYEGVIRDALISLKSNGRAALWYELRDLFRQALVMRREQGIMEELEEAEIVVPVPLHKGRLWKREFNQSYWLAREVGAFLGVCCEDLLLRVRATPPQRGHSLKERERNVKGAFEMKREMKWKRVVVVDDIATSLATANEVAKVLKRTGAQWVGLVTFARTLRNEPAP
jgi:ComF family protein